MSKFKQSVPYHHEIQAIDHVDSIVFSVYLIRCDLKCFVFQIALTWHHNIIFNKQYSTIGMPVALP